MEVRPAARTCVRCAAG
nr:hypothetical protein [Streptomyces naganishii]